MCGQLDCQKDGKFDYVAGVITSAAHYNDRLLSVSNSISAGLPGVPAGDGRIIRGVCQQFANRFSQHRMNETRDELVEWDEDETARVKPRMRQREKLRLHVFVFENQKVEIDGARTHANLARPAERVLDSQQPRHDGFGRGKRRTAQFRDKVEE